MKCLFHKIKSQLGMTLIEGILSISVMGIISVTAIPHFVGNQVRLNGAMGKIQSDTVYAQQLALATGDNHGLIFYANGQYSLYQSTRDNILIHPVTGANYTVDLTSYGLTSLTETVGGVYPEGVLVLDFDKDGFPTMGGGANLRLNSGEDFLWLAIAPSTGAISEIE